MLKSGPSTSSGQSSSSPHIVARGIRVLYCKYETVKGLARSTLLGKLEENCVVLTL